LFNGEKILEKTHARSALGKHFKSLKNFQQRQMQGVHNGDFFQKYISPELLRSSKDERSAPKVYKPQRNKA
jgi:hypothetical protein